MIDSFTLANRVVRNSGEELHKSWIMDASTENFNNWIVHIIDEVKNLPDANTVAFDPRRLRGKLNGPLIPNNPGIRMVNQQDDETQAPKLCHKFNIVELEKLLLPQWQPNFPIEDTRLKARKVTEKLSETVTRMRKLKLFVELSKATGVGTVNVTKEGEETYLDANMRLNGICGRQPAVFMVTASEYTGQRFDDGEFSIMMATHLGLPVCNADIDNEGREVCHGCGKVWQKDHALVCKQSSVKTNDAAFKYDAHRAIAIEIGRQATRAGAQVGYEEPFEMGDSSRPGDVIARRLGTDLRHEYYMDVATAAVNARHHKKLARPGGPYLTRYKEEMRPMKGEWRWPGQWALMQNTRTEKARDILLMNHRSITRTVEYKKKEKYRDDLSRQGIPGVKRFYPMVMTSDGIFGEEMEKMIKKIAEALVTRKKAKSVGQGQFQVRTKGRCRLASARAKVIMSRRPGHATLRLNRIPGEQVAEEEQADEFPFLVRDW
jgi:hypothetical protein